MYMMFLAMKRSYFFSLVFVPLLLSWDVGDYQQEAQHTLTAYYDLNSALKTLYDHYDPSDPRFDAVCFLLAGLPGKSFSDNSKQMERYMRVMDSIAVITANDISLSGKDATLKATEGRNDVSIRIYDYAVLNADSLIKAIDCAFEVWNAAPWRGSYQTGDFMEYVLPYRISQEPLEYYWRWDALNRYYAWGDDLLDAAQQINSSIKYLGDLLFKQAGLQGYSMMLRSKSGKCEDRAILVAMAMRAHGIPAAFDFIPQWGGYNSGHAICSVVLPDGKSAAFHTPDDDGQNTFFLHKTPKIYRRMYAQQRNTILFELKDEEPIPPFFAGFNIMDVTSSHSIGFADLNVDIPARATTHKIVYLGIFSPAGWTLIACTENRGANTLFEAVGTGTDAKNELTFTGEHIGRGILYMPCAYDGKVVPINNPLIHSPEGVKVIVEDVSRTEEVILSRKFPRLSRVIDFAEQMTGGVFEGSNRPDFSDAVELHYIHETPLSRMQRIELDTQRLFRYVRYRKSSGAFSIGEMKFFGENGQELKGKVIAYNLIAQESDLKNIADGDPLTFFSVVGMFDAWAGIDFGKPVTLGALAFCPRTDDNDISPGDTYELLYWSSSTPTLSAEWRSLGIQNATGYELLYNDVPTGALLWLRDLTRGREERPFTYENGEQIWW